MEKWQCLSALNSLRSLRLNNFWLADLPAEVMLLTKLTCLHIDNGLGSMSRDMSPLENLVELGLSCEKLRSLPTMLSTCKSLEELVLTECRMEIGSEGVDALKCLPRLQHVHIDRHKAAYGAELLPGIVHPGSRVAIREAEFLNQNSEAPAGRSVACVEQGSSGILRLQLLQHPSHASVACLIECTRGKHAEYGNA